MLWSFPYCLLLLLCPRFRCTFDQCCRHFYFVSVSFVKLTDRGNKQIHNKILVSDYRLDSIESLYFTACDLNVERCFDISINMHG